MDKVKIMNINTGVVKEVSKAIASDFVGTKEWKIVDKETEKKETKPKTFVNSEE